jgi:NRPS condensation-like uncharacterized protein
LFKGFDALTLWPFIFIDPQFINNQGLIEHEMVHYKEQAWITPYWIAKYAMTKKFRLGAEVRGYKRQIEVNGITTNEAANLLTNYGVGISYEEAIHLLR